MQGKREKWNVIRTGIVMLVVMLLVACEKDSYQGPDEQPVFFEYHYVNFAWGHQDSGWLIDRDGNVRGFEYPEDYRHVVHGEYLSLEDLEYNLGQTDSSMQKVDSDEMRKYTDHIPAAARGVLDESRSVGADGGSAVLSCYWYDAEEDAYQYVLLAAKGDWEQFNLSSDAEVLVDWLSGFGVHWFDK